MTNPDTLARWKWLNGRGVPTFLVDGKTTVGGGGRDNTPELEKRVRAQIDKELDKPADAHLSVAASRDGNTVRVKTNVTEVKPESPDLKVEIALVEKLVRYSGENGIRFHPMVVRSFAEIPLKGERAREFEQVFDLAKVTAKLKEHLDNFEIKDERGNPDGKFRFMEKKHQVDPNKLAVVVYVQDDKTKDVLQSAYVDLTPVSGVVLGND